MPNTNKCSDINTNSNLKNCYTCLDSSYQCYWSDDKKKCSSFQDEPSFYNKLNVDKYDASKCTKPDIPLTNINDECSANADCNEGSGGKCFYNYDYESPIKKCFYPCTKDTDCSEAGEKCIGRNGIPTSQKYCGVLDPSDDNNVNRRCSVDANCNSDETCRPGFNGVKLCALKTPQPGYSTEGTNFGSSSTPASGYSSQIAQNQETADQLFNDIQSLQSIEQDLFNSLDDQSLNNEKRSDIINKINSISEMRLKLYDTLSDVNGYFTTLNSDSTNSMSDQSSAIKIVEEQLNKSKQSLMDSENDKNNKIRMIQINSYYSQRYAEHSDLMIITIGTLIPVILVTFLYNNSLLPYNVFFVLIVFIGLYGAFLFLNRLASVLARDSINYQEYLWSFNKNTAPVPIVKKNESSNPWGSMNLGTCIGANCCSVDTVWNDKTRVCDSKT
jgi:hypothetical protein